MEMVILYLIGVLVGSVITQIILRKRHIGYLRIDNSDPSDNPYIFLELTKPMDVIYTKQYVTLEVKVKDYIPRN